MLFKTHLIALLCLCAATFYAQERKPLNGKVIADTEALEGIYVINKTADAHSLTTRGGYYTINALPGDTLVVSSPEFNAKAALVTEESFGPDLFFVSLEPFDYKLAELVIVDYSHINSESLGLVPQGQKRYTPAERRDATASSWKMNPLGLDPIFNMFSGRGKMLKQAVEIEKKETLMQKIGYLYPDEDIVAKLKVPVAYVQGFLYYAVENKYFVKAMDENNEEMAKFLLSSLATKYNKLLADEGE